MWSTRRSATAGTEDWEQWRRRANESPFYRLLGMEVAEMGEGFARLRMPVSQNHHQIYGSAHGGAIGSLADSAVALALITLIGPEEKAITIELKVNFLAPVVEGEVVAEARIVHRGRRIAVGDVEVKADNGKMVAKGIATYLVAR